MGKKKEYQLKRAAVLVLQASWARKKINHKKRAVRQRALYSDLVLTGPDI